ncbi:hypothetical protein CASFOL_002350 [Castilleja foliolosa]|uniref:Uncharacterized protein n=1 Tax=Castilleja foliolosa TaxID=1961234 RepID=A0ABD3EHZ8_9LAMI
MKIPAWWFFWFWSLISITSLHLCFISLDQTNLSNSLSPVIISVFKHSLAVFTCSSSSYALIFRPGSKLSVEWRYFWICIGIICALANYSPSGDITTGDAFLCGPILCALLCFVARLRLWPPLKTVVDRYWVIVAFTLFLNSALFSWYLHVFTLVNVLMVVTLRADCLSREAMIGTGIHMAIESSLFIIDGEKTTFYPVIVMFVSFLISALRAGLYGLEPMTMVTWEPGPNDKGFLELLLVASKGYVTFSAFMATKIGKVVGFAVGMAGSVLFQSFVGLTSLDHVVAFIYLEVMWVANVALLGICGDFGVLNFLIGNVILGCTASQFGLGCTTWLAYGSSLVLYGLRLYLASVAFESRDG